MIYLAGEAPKIGVQEGKKKYRLPRDDDGDGEVTGN